MRSIKIENVRTGEQFAFGGHDGHKRDNVVGVVTRKAGTYLLHTNPGTKDASTTEVRRDQRILVDYDTSTVAVKCCTKDAEHGPKIAYPHGNLYCKPCHDEHLAAPTGCCWCRTCAAQRAACSRP